MKISRREIAMAVAGSALGAKASAQVAATPAPDIARAVRDTNRRNAETLAKVEIPVATEPSFQFRA